MTVAIVLVKFKTDSKSVARYGNSVAKSLPSNIKIKDSYWTFGRYDAVWVIESTNEKTLFDWFLKVGRQDIAKTETLISIPRSQAMNMINGKNKTTTTKKANRKTRSHVSGYSKSKTSKSSSIQARRKKASQRKR